MRTPHARVPALLALVAAGLTSAPAAGAQVTEVTRRQISEITHLTFGSLCEDRFVIRNDGVTPVNLEYAVTKGSEHTRLTLGARELVELESRSKEPLELWMDGKLIAKAEKEGRKCRDVQGNASVAVAPLDVQSNERDDRRNNNNARFGYGFGYGAGFYDPWYGPYGGYGWGFRPFYSGFYGVPIIIGGGRGGGRRR